MSQEVGEPAGGAGRATSPGEPITQLPVPPGVGICIGFQAGPVPPQLLDQITPEHISRILESQESQVQRQHELALKQLEARERDRRDQRDGDRKRERNWLLFGGAVLAFVFVLAWVGF